LPVKSLVLIRVHPRNPQPENVDLNAEIRNSKSEIQSNAPHSHTSTR
jgi:hypothetical protein